MTTTIQLTKSDHTQEIVDFKDLLQRFRYTLLYFYPKDDTPGCSLEAHNFNKLLKDFSDLETQVIGVSKDDHESHVKFQKKHKLAFSLISDSDLSLHKNLLFNTWIEKTIFGKKSLGTSRDSFLLNQDGQVLKERRKVKPATHPQEVLEYLQSL